VRHTRATSSDERLTAIYAGSGRRFRLALDHSPRGARGRNSGHAEDLRLGERTAAREPVGDKDNSVVTAFVTDTLVGTLGPFADAAHLSEFFVAVVIVAIVGKT
jgi:hypothetical protein